MVSRRVLHAFNPKNVEIRVKCIEGKKKITKGKSLDICGSFSIETQNGQHYLVRFINDYF